MQSLLSCTEPPASIALYLVLAVFSLSSGLPLTAVAHS